MEPDKLDIKRHLHGFLIYCAFLADLMAKDCKTNEKQTQFCLTLLTWRMHYDIMW